MKRTYETPEFEVKKFDIQTDILANEGSLPEGGGEIGSLSTKNPIPVPFNGPGFGW